MLIIGKGYLVEGPKDKVLLQRAKGSKGGKGAKMVEMRKGLREVFKGVRLRGVSEAKEGWGT